VRHHYSILHKSEILIVIHPYGYLAASIEKVLQEDSSLIDDPLLLFDRYSQVAQVEDEKTANDRKAVASDTLTFVSPNLNFVVHP
jgi:hypothetical protein